MLGPYGVLLRATRVRGKRKLIARSVAKFWLHSCLDLTLSVGFLLRRRTLCCRHGSYSTLEEHDTRGKIALVRIPGFPARLIVTDLPFACRLVNAFRHETAQYFERGESALARALSGQIQHWTVEVHRDSRFDQLGGESHV